MRIVLTGYMGAGKTTIGRELARQLGWRFVDVDEVIVGMAGMTIPELFAQGEDVFRHWEQQAIAAHAHDEEVVVATGGGAVTREDTRGLLEAMGPVVCLTAPPEVLWQRAGADPNRPLGQDRAGFLARLERRQALYDRFPLKLDTSLLGPEELAREIAATLEQTRVDVALGERAYAIDVAPGCLWRLPLVLPGALFGLRGGARI